MAKGTLLFGWCMTGHHEKCIKKLTSFPDIACPCQCHQKATKVTKRKQGDA